MFNTKKSSYIKDPWGEGAEKLKNSNENLLGFKDQIKGLVSPGNMLDMVFRTPKSGEMANKTAERKVTSKRNENIIFSRTTQEQQNRLHKETSIVLNQLKEQIAILEKSEKSLTLEISKIQVDQMPSKTGIYYLRYFEWLITIVKQLRMRIEDGKAWLQEFNCRKKKKLGYWQKYKKHGTTFGLSHERSLATSTG